MRDGNIFRMTDDINKKIAVLYKQIQFLDSRLMAYESLFEDRKNFLLAFFKPEKFRKQVDAIQLKFLELHDAQLRKAMQEKKEEAAKPKLTLPPNMNKGNGLAVAGMILLVSFTFAGCVTKKTYKKGIEQYYKEGYEAAEFKCNTDQRATKEYTQSLLERLKKFNQVDDKGNLYPPKPKWKGAQVEDEVTGKESWQK